jgi:catechol 2,3-dioxygenase-like lactoylglutathione lyase family enzyme
MQIKITAIPVDDQDKALDFYTNKLGFTKKADIHIGPLRWLTVSSPEGPEGVELVLQTMDFPPSRIYQKARFDADIPAVAFISNDVHAEYARLARGVRAAEGARGQVPRCAAKLGPYHRRRVRGRMRQSRQSGSACTLSDRPPELSIKHAGGASYEFFGGEWAERTITLSSAARFSPQSYKDWRIGRRVWPCSVSR